MSTINVIELRNYLLKPASRDKFIQYFQQHFVVSQNILGAHTPAQFRIKSEPDRFFWIRGFDSMQARSQFLPDFYGGEVWKEFGPEANEMMLEWHEVHLLKPIEGSVDGLNNKQGLWVIDYFTAVNKKPDQLSELLVKHYVPALHSYGANNLSVWSSEMATNDFSRLPVHQQENLVVVISVYRDEQEYALTLRQLPVSHTPLINEMAKLIQERNTLALYPA